MHNMLYWQGGEYFGCGPSAHSHWNGARFGNVRDLQGYCDRLQRGEKSFDEIERLSPEAKARETLVMWMRLLDGVSEVDFHARTEFRLEELCGPAIEEMIAEGLLRRADGNLRLTSDALFVSNAVFTELV